MDTANKLILVFVFEYDEIAYYTLIIHENYYNALIYTTGNVDLHSVD